MGKGKEKIIILMSLILLYLLMKLSLLFFGFDKIYGYGFGETQFGACARELIRSANLPISCFDYIGAGLCKLTNSCASALLMDVLVVPFFMLFGTSYLALKLVPLSFNLVIFIFLYLFLYRFFNKRIAIITSILYIFPPSVFTSLSFGCNTNKCEFTLFTILTMYIFFVIFFNKINYRMNFILFGVISALGLCLNYIFLITIITCFLLWFILDRKFFLKSDFFIFLGAFLVSLLPWIYYVVHNIGGVYIYAKPLYGHFLGNGIVNSLIRLKGLVSTQLFNIFIMEDIGFIKGYFLGLIYYIIFLFSFCVFSWQNMKYLFKLLFKAPPKKQLQATSDNTSKMLFIFIYMVVFFITCSFSDFPVSGAYSKFNFINYRFLASTYPFLIVIIVIILDRLSFKKYISAISNSIITILILISLLSNLTLISLNRFGEGFKYEGYSYIELGTRLAIGFGEKINKAVKLINQVDSDNRELMYQGFTAGFVRDDFDYNHIVKLIDIVKQKIDKEHYFACLEGLGMGFGQIVWENDVMEGIDLIKRFDPRYQGYFYQGVGLQMISRNMFGLDSPEYISRAMNKIEEFYRSFYCRGMGMNIGFSMEQDMFDCINKINQLDIDYKKDCYYGLGEAFGLRVNLHNIVNYISKINQVDGKYIIYCYQGLGRGISFRYGYYINKCIEMIDKVDEDYKPYCYYGLGIGIGAKYGYDINKCKEILGQIEKQYRDNFRQGLINGISYYWEKEASL